MKRKRLLIASFASAVLVCCGLASCLAARDEPEVKTAGTPALTNREQDVLQLVAKGLTNQMIADQLQIDERTVRIHVSHILQKLGLENRTQATLYALRHGFATLD